ncbi:hypothetical protein EZS27_030362 [termite gut metagenome]|uniref:Uncharacterized protein n=1 Tax=termite gut metagenome TaxID=433724 RepID=A0A5J4QFQ3_9ZZZZ
MSNDMTDLKIIEKNDLYTVYEAEFEGTKQLFRRWYNDLIEIKFTDAFASANGYRSRVDMIRREPEMKERLQKCCGCIPEWLSIINGEFCVRATKGNVNLN